jgi:long-chain fatty acid transport protein
VRRALVAAAVLASAARAGASGLTPPSVGHVWSGPVTADAAAVFWNPAMLADVRKARIEGNVDLVFPSIRYTRERRGVYQREDSFKFRLPLEESDIDRSKTGVGPEVAAQNVLIPAGSLFAAVPVHDRVTMGFGFFGLAGAIITFPEFGPARYQLQEASLLGMALTAGVGIRVNEWLRVGVTAYYVAGRMGLRKVADLAGTDLLGKALANPPINQPNDFGMNAPTGVRELAVLSRPFTLTGAAASSATFSLGLAFEPSKVLTIGLAYVHQVPLKLQGRFGLDMNDEFFTQDLAAQGLKYPPLVEGDAFVEFSLPSVVKLGVAVQPSKDFRLQLLVEYFRYSELKAFNITLRSAGLAQPSLGVSDVVKLVEPLSWKDTVTVGATGIVRAFPSVELGLGLGYQSSASPDSTISLASPDGDRIVASAGGRLTVGRFELTGALQVHHVLTRTVTASDFDKANGTYKVTLVLFSGSLAVTF